VGAAAKKADHEANEHFTASLDGQKRKLHAISCEQVGLG
jgi:hypothetical protein